jgi:hypothetical protein
MYILTCSCFCLGSGTYAPPHRVKAARGASIGARSASLPRALGLALTGGVN